MLIIAFDISCEVGNLIAQYLSYTSMGALLVVSHYLLSENSMVLEQNCVRHEVSRLALALDTFTIKQVFYGFTWSYMKLPSRELTNPTNGIENSSSQLPLDGIC